MKHLGTQRFAVGLGRSATHAAKLHAVGSYQLLPLSEGLKCSHGAVILSTAAWALGSRLPTQAVGCTQFDGGCQPPAISRCVTQSFK
mmetsp:Transcript_11827/g.26865  ORF Transcript_11827/g.26865 Transcript_11827/m.26865 type:complete len:87 (+) Transcript_11827:2206-2466(+)